MSYKSTLGYLLATVFGISLTLSFAPFHAWWFAPYCMAGLFLLLFEKSPADTPYHSWLIGLSFGLGYFGSGLWWLYPGMNEHTAAGPWISAALSIGIIFYVSFFTACSAALIVRLAAPSELNTPGHMRRLLMCLAIASIWTALEWLRGIMFGGLPWLATGYAQIPGPLTAYAPIAGALGIGFLSTAAAAILALAALELMHRRASPMQLLPSLLPILIILAGGLLLRNVEWTQDTGKKISVRLIQGNLSPLEKFSAAGLKQAVSTYVSLTETSNAALTVFPETVFPIEWNSLPDGVKNGMQTLADTRSTTILFGAAISNLSPANAALVTTNSAIAILPQGEAGTASYQYDKIHLVPIGEYLPTGTGWLETAFKMDFGAFLSGQAKQAPLALAQGKLALSICYEDMFDTEIAGKASAAEGLINLSNFSWFAGTFAADQHAQMGQMRAVETGRWMAQASNSGVTALIDNHGEIRDALPADITAALDGEMELRSGDTPFMRLGNFPTLGISMLILICWSVHRRRIRNGAIKHNTARSNR